LWFRSYKYLCQSLRNRWLHWLEKKC